MRFNKLVPELSVSDINVSKQFYTDVLGFSVEYERKENKKYVCQNYTGDIDPLCRHKSWRGDGFCTEKYDIG